MSFSFRSALKLIFSKKKKTLINFLSYTSIITLSIGTAAMVVILSVYNGLEETLKSIYNDFDPDIKVEKAEGLFFENKFIDQINQLNSVKGVSAIIENKVVIQNQEKEVVTYIKGVDNNFINQNRIKKNLTEGDFIFQKNTLDYGVIGRGVKYSLGIKVDSDFQSLDVFALNQTINLNPNSLSKKLYNKKPLKVGGVFAIESSFDNNYIFTSLNFAQNLLNQNNNISAYEISLVNKFESEKTKEKIIKLLGNSFKVSTGLEQREGLYKILKSEKLVVYFVFFIVLILCSINIFFLLIMVGVEKKKDIAVMFSLGVKKHQIRNIFLLHGIITGIIGACFGVTAGALITWTQKTYGIIKIQMTSSILDAYPVSLLGPDIIIITFMVITVATLASLFPAIMSSSNKDFINTKNILS